MYKSHPNLQYMYLKKALDTEFLLILFGQCLLLGLLVFLKVFWAKSQEAVMLCLVCQAYIHSQSILVGTQAPENQVTPYTTTPRQTIHNLTTQCILTWHKYKRI